jgi:hypothetical protein
VTWLKGLKVIWSNQTRRMSFWIMNTTLLSRWWLWIEGHGTLMCLKWTKWSTNKFLTNHNYFKNVFLPLHILEMYVKLVCHFII